MEQCAVAIAIAKVTIRLVAQSAKSDMNAQKKKILIAGSFRTTKRKSVVERSGLVATVKKRGTPSEPASILKLTKKRQWR